MWTIVTNYLLQRLRCYVSTADTIVTCYVRHGASHESPNLFLADIDLVVFVRSRSWDEFSVNTEKIACELSKVFYGQTGSFDVIYLPATWEIWEHCLRYYPFRHCYPVSTWRPVNSSTSHPEEMPGILRSAAPLDHSPENAIQYYILPVLRGERASHRFQRALLKRKVDRDVTMTGATGIRRSGKSIFDTLRSEMQIWDNYYSRLTVENEPQSITHTVTNDYKFPQHEEVLDALISRGECRSALDSLWLYPRTIDDNTPHVVINLNAEADSTALRMVVSKVQSALRELRYELWIGTEKSMIARINGLSRLHLLEPWLFASFGTCLRGSEDLRNRITPPGPGVLGTKFQEFLLYLIYDLMLAAEVPHNYFRLLFVLDHLSNSGMLVFNDDDLHTIYGAYYFPGRTLTKQAQLNASLEVLKTCHGLDVFGSPFFEKKDNTAMTSRLR